MLSAIMERMGLVEGDIGTNSVVRDALKVPANGSVMTGLKSLVVMHLPDVSGPSRSLDRELRWLAAQGEMEVLLSGQGQLSTDFGEFAHVRALDFSVLTVPRSPAAWPGASRRFEREIRGFRKAIRAVAPDLVVVTSALLPSALLAARLEHTPSILYAGEILDRPRVDSRPRAFAGQALIRAAGRLSTTIIACSDRVGRQYASHSAANVRTIHPPIDSRYADGDGERFREKHEIPLDAPLLLAVGALTHGRGQDLLISALPAIREAHPDMRLAIVGEPHPREVDHDYAQELLGLAAKLAPGAVSFTGFEPHVEDAYAAANVVVNPARYEAFGRVAFEALAAGRPVVSTSAGAVPEVLRDRQDALLVDPESPLALEQAVGKLIRDVDLAGRLADTGGARVRADLTPDGSLARFRSAVVDTLDAC